MAGAGLAAAAALVGLGNYYYYFYGQLLIPLATTHTATTAITTAGAGGGLAVAAALVGLGEAAEARALLLRQPRAEGLRD